MEKFKNESDDLDVMEITEKILAKEWNQPQVTALKEFLKNGLVLFSNISRRRGANNYRGH